MTKPETVMFASGWIEGRIEDLLAGYTKAGNTELATLMVEMQKNHKIVDDALQALIRDNNHLRTTLQAVRDVVLGAGKVNVSVDI